MSHLVLDETNTSTTGSEMVGESQDWGGNDYVFWTKTRPNGVIEIRGIGGVEAVRVEGRRVEAAGEIAADTDDAEARRRTKAMPPNVAARPQLFRTKARGL
jgi:hypothetical protein